LAFKRVVWSLVELEWLKKNRTKPVNQLCIALSKTQGAIKKQLKLLDDPAAAKKMTLPGRRRSKIGKRKDCNNLFFRSGWEANVYRYLKTDKTVRLIEYEPTTFSFTSFGILKGTVSYTPDFKVTFKDGTYIWIEVKGGWMKTQDGTKLRRFKKFFPDEFSKLEAVTPGPTSKTTKFFEGMRIKIRCMYPELNRQCKNTVAHWE